MSAPESLYFKSSQPQVLDRVPLSLLYLAAIYGGIFVLGKVYKVKKNLLLNDSQVVFFALKVLRL